VKAATAAAARSRGAQAWSGVGVQKSPKRGLELVIAGCELGGATSCASIARLFKEDPDAGKRSRERALSALHVACEQDESAEACEALRGMEELPGEHQALPVCSAGDFKACRASCEKEKSSAACLDFGVALLYGTGVRRRSADALALFTEACREGSAKGCSLRALVSAGQSEDPKAESRAAGDFEAACVLGEASGCVQHALMELEGLGTYRDEEAAATALGEACEKGTAIACAHLATLSSKGLGVAKDEAKAKALLERACKGGFRPACR
jgi:TPR repeat protein